MKPSSATLTEGPRATPSGGIPDRWLMLACLFTARTAITSQFQTVASAGPFLPRGMGVEFATLGTLIGLYMLPGVFIALPGGVLGQRYGAKRIVLVGLALMAAGGLLTAHPSIHALFLGRALSGIGAILLNVLMTKMVIDWFAGRDIVTAMGVLVASWPFGIALGLVAFPSIALSLGWGAIMLSGAVAAVCSLLLVWLAYRDPPRQERHAERGIMVELDRSEWLLVSLAGAVWGTFNVAYVVLVSFLPELLAAQDYTRPQAAALVSLLGWALIPLAPFGGYLTGRLGRPTTLMLGSFVVVGAAAAALPTAGMPLVLIVALAIAFALPAGLILSLPDSALAPRSRASGMGVFYTWFYVLMAALPAVAGSIHERSADPAEPVLFASVMMVVAACCLLLFKAVARVRAGAETGGAQAARRSRR